MDNSAFYHGYACMDMKENGLIFFRGVHASDMIIPGSVYRPVWIGWADMGVLACST